MSDRMREDYVNRQRVADAELKTRKDAQGVRDSSSSASSEKKHEGEIR